ncbi:hypothetical protein GCM10023093_24070 [Nemorincola caseinilytica]|uniref:DMT family transporter n=1 Tax=Nemorincola caseinilytica TaxID=2054315 RepID=A0ABP8NLD6_9BACT
MQHRADVLVYKFSPLIVIVAAVVYNLSLDALLDIGYSSSSVLVYRGMLSMAITVLFALNSGQSVMPKKLHLQLLRLTNSGVGLLLAFEAYKGLTASTVAMVSRLDIPIAVMIGFMAGKRKRDFKVGLSVFAICLVLSILFFSSTINEDPVALGLSIIAVVQISISYLLIKRSTRDENNFSIVNTTNIGCLLVGGISGLLRGNIGWFHIEHLWILALASLSQFALNYTSSVVYRRREVERAQRPYLIGSLVVMVIEQVITWHFFAPLHIAYILAVIGVIYIITLRQMPGHRQAAWVKSKLSRGVPEEEEDVDIVRSVD